ncbi:hypothetical protein BsWGS_17608 [Bradybaena similaris]
MSESGFRDVKGTAGNVPTSLPARNSESTGDITIQSTQQRSHPEKGSQVSAQGIEEDQENEEESRISQKPSAPPKTKKPTIIRSGTRAQPVTGEDKPLPPPPPRPTSTPKSDPSLQKSTSLQGIQNSQQQPPQAQRSLPESTDPPPTNNHPFTQSSVSHQAPKRPPRLPSSGVPLHKTTANIQDAGTKLGASSETQSPPKETPLKNASLETESPKTESALPKPKPVPKPRPVSVRSPEFKSDTTSDNIVNKDLNTSAFLPDLSIKPHDTQEDILSQKSKWSPVTHDEKIAPDERPSLAPVPLRKPTRPPETTSKPGAVSKTDVSEKTVKQDTIPTVGQEHSPHEQLPAVHKLPPVVPPASHASGSSGSKPSPIATRKPDTPSNSSSHINHTPASTASPKMPPARPATSAPVRGKSMAIGEKVSPVSGNNSSPSSVKKVDSGKPSQPTASSRSQQKSGLPPLPKRPGPGHPLYHYISKKPHGIARHDYTATQPDELSFSEGDTVLLVKEIDEQWMVGRKGDQEGMFPAAFVDIRCPISKEKPNNCIDGVDSWSASHSHRQEPDIVTGPRCKARFDFDGDGEGELRLEDGDIVQIIERVGTEWLRGQHRGRQGIFPSSFVEIVEDLPLESSTYGQISSNRVSALFDFDGKDGELIFKAGDEITILAEVNSEWLFGACHGQEGQLPTSFISHVPPNLPKHKLDHSAQKPKQTPQTEQVQTGKKHQDFPVPGDEFWDSREDVLGYCRAMFDYIDPTPGDLEFRKGDRIEIVEFCGEDWARGRLGRREGMFPLRFVAEEVNSPPKTPEPVVVEKVFGKVLHHFDGETADDLMIKEGDIIEVEDFADINKHWRWGILDGKRGMFPAEFVEILQ